MPKIYQGVNGVKSFIRSGFKKSAAIPVQNEHLLKYKGIEQAIGEYGHVNLAKYRIKPDITIPVNVNTMYLSNPAIELRPDLLKFDNPFQCAELGNVSMRLASKYEKALPSAEKEIKDVFEGFDVSVRAKGANSVYSKLKRVIVKSNNPVKTDEQARHIVLDAIGGRIQLPDLTKQDVIDTVSTIRIDGKGLSHKEQRLVLKLFKGDKLTSKELDIANKYAKQVKFALAERQSEPVVRRFLLGGLKDALDRKITTIDKLEKSGIRKDLIAELKSNPSIKPLKMTEINNYKGTDGIAYFSDRQIREFEKLQLATGEKIDIITCSENIDLAKYGLENLSKSAQDAIKKSGYTTGQINVVLKDGTFAEIQVRGSGPFGEYEHLKYDSVLGKNTLGEIFQPYSKEVQAVGAAKQMPAYDKYVSDTYDYYRNKEVRVRVPKPQLPQGFNTILSEESMRKLHELNQLDQAKKMKSFIPHIEDNTGKTYIV